MSGLARSASGGRLFRERADAGFLLLSLFFLMPFVALLRLDRLHGTLRDGVTPQTIGWVVLAFAFYLGAILWAEISRSASMRLVWIVAIVARLLLLFTPPTLSDDVYRYLWDGHLSSSGISPYAQPVDSPALDPLDIPARSLVNNAWMASPYMPAAQFLFGGLAAALPLTPVVFQGAIVVLELLGALLLARLLGLVTLPAYRLLIYLWNPLVVVETAHAAHVDSYLVLLSLAAIWFTLAPAWRGSASWRWLAAPILLALATLTKILPLLFMPVLFWQWRWRQRLLFPLALLALLLPFGLQAGWGLSGELDGRGLFGALRIYGHFWQFNSGLFHWLEKWLNGSASGSDDQLLRQSMLLLTGLVALLVWLAARREQRPLPLLRLIGVPYMAYFLLTPTVHPWYILPILALLPFLPPRPGGDPQYRRGAVGWLLTLPWLYLSVALFLSYLTYFDPLHFHELEWVRRAEWLPALSLATLAGAGLVWSRHVR